MQGATDSDVLAHTASQQRVLVTTNGLRHDPRHLWGGGPCVLLLRGVGHSIDERINATLHALSVVEEDLISRAVAVVEIDCIRLRRLPIDES